MELRALQSGSSFFFSISKSSVSEANKITLYMCFSFSCLFLNWLFKYISAPMTFCHILF